MRIKMNRQTTKEGIRVISKKMWFASVLLLLVIVSIPKVADAETSVFTSTQLRLSGAGSDSVRVITPTTDGGFIASVVTNSTDGDFSGLGTMSMGAGSVLVKFDTNINILWKKLFDGYGIKGIFPIDSGYITVGESFSGQAVITRIDLSGTQVWKKEYGGSATDTFASIVVKNNAIYAVGSSQSTDGDLTGLNKGAMDAVLVKYDINGNKLWTKTFGGTANDEFLGVQVINDGSIVAIGQANSTDGDMTSTLASTQSAISIAYDENGNIKYKSKLGGSLYDVFNTISKTEDGGYIVAGETSSTDGDLSGYSTDNIGGALLVKYDSAGSKQWTRVINGEYRDKFHNVAQISNGNYIAVGSSASSTGIFQGLNAGRTDGIIVELDNKGNLIRIGNEGGEGQDYFYTGAILKDGNTYVTGGDTSSGLNGTYIGRDAMEGFIHVYKLGIKSAAPEFLSDIINLTNKNVKVTINYPPNITAKQYKIGSQGIWTNYTAPVVMTENNTLFARFTNSNGTQSQEYTYVVSNIDKTPPTLPKFVPDIVDPTKSNVNVTIDYPNEIIKEYRVNGGTWTTYTKPVLFTTNGSIEARVTDNAGNSSSAIYSVSNIDRTPPGVTSFSSDITGPTNSNVTVSISYPADGYRNEYKVGTGEWQVYFYSPVNYYARENITLYAKSTDKAGNVSEIYSYEVKNIDKVPPANATLAADITTPTNKDVKVTINYPSDAVIKEYKEGLGNYKAYTNPITITSNTTVYARSKDAAGNYSAETKLIISNIDKTPPSKPVITADRTKPTEGIVTISINYPDSEATKEYRQNGGAWKNYSGPIVYTVAGNLEARAVDGVGNVSTVSLAVTVRPDAPISISADITKPTTSDVTVTVTYPANSITKEYQLNSGTWKSYTGVVKLTANGTIQARTKDSFGYTSNIINYTVSNIDRTPPSKPVISPDTLKPTAGNVTVTIKSDADAQIFYSTGSAYIPYTDPVIVTDNRYVSAYAVDALGNKSDFVSYQVTNIDRVPPAKPIITADITKVTNQDVKLTIQYQPKSSRMYYRINGGKWNTIGVDSPPIVMNANGTLEAKSFSRADVESEIGIYYVKNIDKVAPSKPINFTQDITKKTNGSVRVSIAYSDINDPVTTKYQIGTTTGEWITYTGPITISSNSIIYTYVEDEAGNRSVVASYSVENIDKEPPTKPLTFKQTNQPNTTQLTISYPNPNDPVIIMYQVGSTTGDWKAYTGPITITSNIIIYIYVEDEAGNRSVVTSYSVGEIDKEPPAEPLIFKQTIINERSIRLAITYPDPNDPVTIMYQVGNTTGNWIVYNTPLEVGPNQIVYVYVQDEAGNKSIISSYKVINTELVNANYHYNSITGRLESIEYTSGEKYVFSYDKNGNLIKMDYQP